MVLLSPFGQPCKGPCVCVINSNSLADFRSGRIAEKQALGFRGGAGQEFAEQVGDEALLELGGLGQAVEDADFPGTLFTA